MINLKGQTALVTGGTRGIGKAVMDKLAGAGADVCFVDLISEGTAQVEEEIKVHGGQCAFYQGNVADLDQCTKIAEDILSRFNKIDILVNNAGITRDSLFMRMSRENWDDVININLSGIFNMCKAVIRPMVKAKYGRIINLSSIVGFTGNPGQVNYSSAKAGLIGFTKSLAKEVASRNVTCNAIAPGFIKSEMTDKLDEEQKKTMLANVPMKRMGTLEDIANGVLFMASPMADYITGTTLHINGGMF
ncbi:MAG: 3-oxoacyl-[acyl-carrier-protein] reductase [Deltaproteobacteria bacterium]|jgi:3-oxoacyl-[acyl-carrier protein] reductase|nr:3-oxoacyl-[acyl-carrier-protein] reductase [Deltaproteobacteria bacterium]MBT4090394.1 3-oxoacyl-[acyl-carrier-protein] reductase [Deltaproteobacteria bacterium]MBT4263577.1 3-oxoacyl-[acyl-carrier-protein] reductase [Deltaproteobacteria bacterium]MBT4644344.1 3-oxoacyl-[acyl-carrier-protein] reductase [Deltaproteobacteria bacterium]MBT6500425.1 3-oxoacyl-[acyl-carrier-protein] reductase [Deltaproteobacteria bacterium]